MRIIFLDFDGVLNTGSYQEYLRTNGLSGWDKYGQLFDPRAVKNLQRILEAVPDIRIIVESSWKVEGLDYLRLMWRDRNLPGDLLDSTPDIFNDDLLTIDLSDPVNIQKVEGKGKGKEISAWLDQHDGQKCQFVILDDTLEFPGELARNHIRIQSDLGITENNVLQALSFFT